MNFIQRFEKTVLDPNTKRSTAFYAALAVLCFDVYKDHATLYNTGGLLCLAGLAVWDMVKSQDAAS